MECNRPIIVFGGAGFIGMSLVRQLASRGYTSIVIADIIAPKGDLPNGTDFSLCDIMDSAGVNELIAGTKPQVVFNLAGFANLEGAASSPKRTFQLNVIGNLNLLEASAKSGVELFVYASSAYAMSDRGSFYGISKLTSEKVVEEFNAKHGLDYVILRYGSIYGAADFENNYLFQLVKKAIKSGSIIHEGDGEEVREYVHVDDVSKLSVDLMEDTQTRNAALMLTGSEKMSRRELFEMIREIVGKGRISIDYRDAGYNNHYRLTPYSFQGTSAKKIVANPYYDMGQGILDCVKKVMESGDIE